MMKHRLRACRLLGAYLARTQPTCDGGGTQYGCDFLSLQSIAVAS